MTADDVRKLLRKAVKEAGNNNAWALQHGVTRAMVGAVLNGTREPGEKILAALGLEKVRVYRVKEQQENVVKPKVAKRHNVP